MFLTTIEALIYFKDFIFWSSFSLTEKLRARYRDFPHLLPSPLFKNVSIYECIHLLLFTHNNDNYVL